MLLCSTSMTVRDVVTERGLTAHELKPVLSPCNKTSSIIAAKWLNHWAYTILFMVPYKGPTQTVFPSCHTFQLYCKWMYMKPTPSSFCECGWEPGQVWPRFLSLPSNQATSRATETEEPRLKCAVKSLPWALTMSQAPSLELELCVHNGLCSTGVINPQNSIQGLYSPLCLWRVFQHHAF